MLLSGQLHISFFSNARQPENSSIILPFTVKMDPLSIVAAAASGAIAIFKISRALYVLQQDTRSVDQTLESFASDINSLQRSLDAIETTLTSSSFQALPAFRHSHISGLFECWFEAVEACQRSLEELDATLQRIFGGRVAPNVFHKAWKQWKLDLESKGLMRHRDRIRMHTSSMQLLLQTIAV